MKVNIGKYKNWVGPYQIAGILKYVGVSDDRCHNIGEKLSNTWITPVCQWIEDKRERKVKIRIDNYDTWSADDTLALIILPVLKQLKEHNHSAPNVDSEDVRKELQATKADLEKCKETGDVDPHWFKRWDYVLNEMIFAFESIVDTSWEDQFSSGVIDRVTVPCDMDGNDVPEEEATLYRWEKGPDYTYELDYDGMEEYNDRIQNGLRLFGKYYRALWT